MSNYTHSIPQEFSDEDRWDIGRFSLSRKSLITLLVGLAGTFLLMKLCSLFHLSIVGVIAGLLLTAVTVACTIIPVPLSDYLKGGGLTMDVIFFRRFLRKRKSAQAIYIKGYAPKK
jgi:hypothetical protein